MSGIRNLVKGDTLFREGDPSDAMFVIKSGSIAIVKSKGSSEIELATLKPGEMLGEMAFFDNKPRSAGAKAALDTTLIELPFKALHAQFSTFPEWLKAMVRTVNSHLRSANQRIKNLERLSDQEAEMFPPHQITRYCAIICLIGYKAGEVEGDGLVIPSGMLRNYTIQIFQQPTHKMTKMTEVLAAMGYLKVEDIGEGRQKITLLDHKKLDRFVDWYNTYLFKEKSKQLTIEQKELKGLRALVFYGKRAEKNEKGMVKVNLTDMQNNSMKDLHELVSVTEVDGLCEKGLVGEKQQQSGPDGSIITVDFDFNMLSDLLPFWELVYTLRAIPIS